MYLVLRPPYKTFKELTCDDTEITQDYTSICNVPADDCKYCNNYLNCSV